MESKVGIMNFSCRVNTVTCIGDVSKFAVDVPMKKIILKKPIKQFDGFLPLISA